MLSTLDSVLSTAWTWVAAPLVALTALVLTVQLRAPQFMRLADAFRGLRREEPNVDGALHPASAAVLAAIAAYGAAAAVGSATAVSLGGAGAVAWVWLFAFLLTPIRVAEALLARTAPAGRTGVASGSLAARMLAEKAPALRMLGWALLALAPVAAFAFYGGVHGSAVIDAADRLLPGSALVLGVAVAAIGAVLVLLPRRLAGSILGWVGFVALLVFFASALIAFFAQPGRAFGGFSRALTDAIYDAQSAGAFSGATAGEIAFAAMLYVFPPIAAPTGIDGGLHAEARALTKVQAATAMLGPLVFALVTTVLGLAFVSTGAFSRATEGERSLREVTAWRVGYETVSQRQEDERLFTGILRVREGQTGAVQTELSTERGMIRAATFEENGQPADVMLRYRDGRPIEIQKPGDFGALQARPFEEIDRIVVKGRMPPRGGTLLARTLIRGGSEILARVGLAALLLLAAVGAAAWGLGLSAVWRSRLREPLARAIAVLPAAGIALAATGLVPMLGAIGSLAACAIVIVGCLALLARGGEAGARLRSK